MQKTLFYNNLNRNWFLIDAKGKILGRLATRIAIILQGKHKPQYSPNYICGDNVVVINAKYIRLTKNKINTKTYNKYSGYPSGRKEITLKELLNKNPSKVLYNAVKGMLPDNLLRKRMLRLLKIYPEDTHPHIAQNPKKIEV